MADPQPDLQSDPPPRSDLTAFLAEYWKDREEDGVRSLGEYVEMFPHLEDAIASEYLALTRIEMESRARAERPRPVRRPRAEPKPEREPDVKAMSVEEEADADLADDPLATVPLRPPVPKIEPREASAKSRARSQPDRLGPYRLELVLGRGGQGTVWLAEDKRLKRKVALKVLSLTGPGSEILLPRFQREAEVASRLDHPGICGVHDTGIVDGVPYIAMRYVAGRTLAELIAAADGPQPAGTFVEAFSTRLEADPEAAERPAGATNTSVDRHGIDLLVAMFEKAARALHVAHEAGIIHRDVKPGNIMVTPEGEPVLLDFGLAQDLGDEAATLTRSGEWFGTPAYMAPEQLDPDAHQVDRRADIWALGVSLYEALTLRRPFAAATRAQLMTSIRETHPTPPGKVNGAVGRDLDVIVATCLRKDADSRYGTALDLAEDLRRVRKLLPILARPLPPLLRFGRWARRHPARAGLLATVVILTPVLSVLLGFIVSTASERDAGRALLRARTIEGHLERGFYELGEGSDDVAMRAFADALAIDPKNPEAAAGRAIAFLETGRPADALIQLDLAHDPVTLNRVRVEVLDAMGRTLESDELRATLGPPEDPEAAFVAGLVAMSRGHRGDSSAFKTAVAHLTTAVQAWPEQPRQSWHIEWLHAVSHAGTREQRDRATIVTLGLWPEAPLVWRWASFALVNHHPKRALRLCERFLAIHPDDAEVRARLAKALSLTGQLDRAQAIAESLVEDAPELAGPLSTLAYIHFSRGRFEEALDYHERSYRLAGPSVVGNQQIAALLMKIDEAANIGRAEKYLLEAEGIKPDLTVRIHLAFCCLMQDRIDEALAWYRKAGDIAPNHIGVWVSLFELYTNTGRYEEALDAARRAYVHAGDDDEYAIDEWLTDTSRKIDAARRLDAIVSGESTLEDALDFATLLAVAEPRGPETIVALWRLAGAAGVISPEERSALGSSVARAAARAASNGQHAPGRWLDPLLTILRDEFRAVRVSPEPGRRAGLAALVDPDQFGVLLEPTFYGDDDARRISMMRLFDDVRRELGPQR